MPDFGDIWYNISRSGLGHSFYAGLFTHVKHVVINHFIDSEDCTNVSQ
jgi:hypothetical protein